MDEHQLEHNGYELLQAAKENKRVWIKYFKDHDFHEIIGYVEPLGLEDTIIKCNNEDGTTSIHYKWLIHVDMQ
ncbi:YolD-like family protein [Virgibacillus sp. NKC19-3]|uniref:YolD-like family protein n=1 Tax=Virgibacillus saliphilus TaxID=2831674 RepID=UPI001C9A9912|nr:YolD-like family protein [Virgibacillus sp. NKC19-3]